MRFRILLAILFAGFFPLALATPAYAWSVAPTAHAECNPDGQGIIVTAMLRSHEGGGSENDIRVAAKFEGRDMQVTSVDDIAEPGHEVRFRLLIPELTSMLPGQVTFNLTWVNREGHDTRYAVTNEVPECVIVTTTTTIPVTTTTIPVTTTTVAATTTTQGTTSTTSKTTTTQAVSTTSTTASKKPGGLAFTGGEEVVLALCGTGAFSGGFGLYRRCGRRKTR